MKHAFDLRSKTCIINEFFCERHSFSRRNQNTPVQVKKTLLSISYSMFFLAGLLKESSVPRRTLKGLKCSVRSPKVGPLKCGTLPTSELDFRKILLMILLLKYGPKQTKHDNKYRVCFSRYGSSSRECHAHVPFQNLLVRMFRLILPLDFARNRLAAV